MPYRYMKQPYLSWRKLGALLLVLTAVIAYSCRKDVNSEDRLSSAEVSAARSWYESAYPQKVGGAFTTLSTTTSGEPIDLTQRIKPDWPKGLSYHRLNNDVVEIPIDASSKFSSAFTMGDGRSRTIYNKAYSRSSFLLFKKSSGYEAYVMTIIADSSYVKSDLGKLNNNTYRKHDADFSGIVMYFTPKGKFVCSYGYRNGQLLPFGKSEQNNGLKAESVNDGSRKKQEIEQDPFTITCTYYYVDHYINDVWVDREWLYRECYPTSGGGNGSGGTSPTTPPKCPPLTGAVRAPKYQVLVDRDPIGENPPPGDGGFPPPVTTTSNCIVVADHKKDLDDVLKADENFLLDCDSLNLLETRAYQSYGSMYQQVAQFSPSQAVMDRINSLQGLSSLSFDTFNIQNLNDAFGPVVNSDFFPVRINQMPTGMTPASLLEYFRTQMLTSNQNGFSPYNYGPINDSYLFNQPGSASIGALVHIDLLADGTVIESDYRTSANAASFKFSTMTSPYDGNHPVAGNREFGVYADQTRPNEFTFYIMGVDRTNDWMYGTMNSFDTGFYLADALWTSMQQQMINYINSHGGQAGFYSNKHTIARPDWNAVKDYLQGDIDLQTLKQRLGC
jgi:hypothetical protein